MSAEHPDFPFNIPPSQPTRVTRRISLGDVGRVAIVGAAVGTIIVLDRTLPQAVGGIMDSVRPLSSEKRAAIIQEIADLQSILNLVVNPQIARFNFGSKIAGGDRELVAWWKTSVIHRSDRRIIWGLNLAEGKTGQLPIPLLITIDYDVTQRMRQALVETNLIKVNQVLDQLSQLINPDSKQLQPDKLQDAAAAFFVMPAGTNWFTLHQKPSLESAPAMVVGKFGGVDYLNGVDRQVFLDVTGNAKMLLTMPLFQVSPL